VLAVAENDCMKGGDGVTKKIGGWAPIIQFPPINFRKSRCTNAKVLSNPKKLNKPYY
jgi:hypothetical protein